MVQSEPCGQSLHESAGKGLQKPVVRHDFGFRVTTPLQWRVEYSPNATMKTGQVAYKTAGDNLFLVAFGGLADVAKSFATLDQYRDASLARLQEKAQITGKLVL